MSCLGDVANVDHNDVNNNDADRIDLDSVGVFS